MKENIKNELNNESALLIARLKRFWKAIKTLKKQTPPLPEDFGEILTPPPKRPKRTAKEAPVKQESPLSPLMKSLPHLHFPEGTLLDYYQSGTSLGSEPEFYVRAENDLRLPHNYAPRKKDPPIVRILDAVRPEFTPEGVWELLLLTDFGSQFKLVWHANYKEARIVCDMEEFLSGKYFGKEESCTPDIAGVSKEDRSQLLSWDVVPRVTLQDEQAIVDYCLFSPFSGFYKFRREIQFKPGISLSEPVVEKRIRYNCGIIF